VVTIITNHSLNLFFVHQINRIRYLSRHINSETTSKYHLYYNLVTDFVYLVHRKRVQRVICNYNTTKSDSKFKPVIRSIDVIITLF
jgi:hypothetical protein